jgi:hypothetical protein
MANNWNAFSTWHLVLPPNRPTDTFLTLIRATTGMMKKRRVAAVLGSTPELRDALALLGFSEVVVFDRDLAFHARMSKLRILNSPERLTEGDWRTTLQEYPRAFDLIVSDLTSGNIEYNDRSEFYGDIARALSDDGLFMDRILVHDFALLSLDNLDRRYASRAANCQTFNDFSSEYLFCSEMLAGRDEVNSALFYDLLDERFREQSYLLGLRKAAELVTPHGSRWFYGRGYGWLESSYFRRFSSTGILPDESGTVFSGKTRILISKV